MDTHAYTVEDYNKRNFCWWKKIKKDNWILCAWEWGGHNRTQEGLAGLHILDYAFYRLSCKAVEIAVIFYVTLQNSPFFSMLSLREKKWLEKIEKIQI